MAKAITYILGSALWLLTSMAPAAAKSYKGDINIVPLRLEQQRDSLYIDMEIHLSGVKVKSAASIDLEPKLVSAEWGTGMPVISIKGRRNYNAYERGLAMDGVTADEGLVMKGYGRNAKVVRYVQTIKYESWMDNARLDMVNSESLCGDSYLVGISRLADSVAIQWPPVAEPPAQPLLVFAEPQAEAVKSREIQAECKLDFVVNKTNIAPSYMNNPTELAKIRGIIDELRTDPSISIVSIEIIGYASPEGSLANNKRLSEGRAMALRDYLSSQYDFPREIYRITFGGENWDGLVQALGNSDQGYGRQVLEIIRSVPIESGRESQIIALDDGEPYRHMLRNIFPSLRTAICKIDYHIKGFEAPDALELFRSRPQNLSLNEFYMVANIMEKGSPDFIEVFETAVRMYPHDETANLNAAVAALQQENTVLAQRYLDKIETPQKNRAEYYNALGTLAWLNGDFDSAADYFGQAATLGLEAAATNLKEINHIKHNKNRQSQQSNNFN